MGENKDEKLVDSVSDCMCWCVVPSVCKSIQESERSVRQLILIIFYVTVPPSRWDGSWKITSESPVFPYVPLSFLNRMDHGWKNRYHIEEINMAQPT
jgi:hypothetical protein